MLSSEEEFDQISDAGSDAGSEIGSDAGSEIGSDSYDNCTVNELKSILSEMNLPLSGNKKKLIQRIKDKNKY